MPDGRYVTDELTTEPLVVTSPFASVKSNLIVNSDPVLEQVFSSIRGICSVAITGRDVGRTY